MCQNEVRDAFRVHYKWTVLGYAQVCRTVAQACREFGVPRSTFYGWKKAYEEGGKAGLARKKPIAKNHPRSLSQDVVDKIVELRKTYKLGPERITCHLVPRTLPWNTLNMF
jgi:transposase-like protein